MVFVFSRCSLSLKSVASLSAFLLSAICCVRSAISRLFCAITDLIFARPALRSSTAHCASSRLKTAAAICASQKAFCVASSAACSAKRFRRSLMIDLTFTKWSSDTAIRSARVDSDELPMRLPASARSSLASSAARTSALLERERTWRNDTTWLTCCFRWMPTSFLFAFQFGATPSFNAAMASLMAVSSAAREDERWSQSCAFSSHSDNVTARYCVSESRSFVS
mmetsp:Transcript_17512/g.49739  ORF Transcript_17512/g.49739 Transcript_17512/m.49739 type:complete len:224 (-) Transcript_17512:472-1143(-)